VNAFRALSFDDPGWRWIKDRTGKTTPKGFTQSTSPPPPIAPRTVRQHRELSERPAPRELGRGVDLIGAERSIREERVVGVERDQRLLAVRREGVREQLKHRLPVARRLSFWP
jgi:hypothetical protein